VGTRPGGALRARTRGPPAVRHPRRARLAPELLSPSRKVVVSSPPGVAAAVRARSSASRASRAYRTSRFLGSTSRSGRKAGVAALRAMDAEDVDPLRAQVQVTQRATRPPVLGVDVLLGDRVVALEVEQARVLAHGHAAGADDVAHQRLEPTVDPATAGDQVEDGEAAEEVSARSGSGFARRHRRTRPETDRRHEPSASEQLEARDIRRRCGCGDHRSASAVVRVERRARLEAPPRATTP